MQKERSGISLTDGVGRLLASQLSEWSLFRQNHSDFLTGSVEYFPISDTDWLGGKRLLSYRKASLSADLDKISRGERRCFLCLRALPVEQEILPWHEYNVLINPYPASALHLTIAHECHVPQSISGRIRDMVDLARELPQCCIFYNGPRCGASAPDHMHFQAIDIRNASNFFGSASESDPFGYFAIESADTKCIEIDFERIYTSLPSCQGSEPMMNCIAFVSGQNKVKLVIIPRRHHRPACYGTGIGEMLVSPASIEMMGLFLTSRPEDYESLDEDKIKEIYREVAYTPQELRKFVQ